MAQPSLVSRTDPGIVIRYALTSRLSAEGRVAISLQLFKGDRVAHSRSLGVVERHQVVDVMFKCRMHLSRLGVQRLTSGEPGPARLPRATGLAPRR